MKSFFEVSAYFPSRIKEILLLVPDEIKKMVLEIRVKKEGPLSLVLKEKVLFLNCDGFLAEKVNLKVLTVNEEEISKIFEMICRYSVQSYEKEIAEGFVTLNGGHRVGICGTAVKGDVKVTALRDITSFNFRLARIISDVSFDFAKKYFSDNLPSVLVAGAPMSGKTTFLRDLIIKLSSGAVGRYIKVSVIDERSEFGEDLGACTDRFTGYPKGVGMQIALRCMSPQVIVIDEIGTGEEVDAIKMSLNAGVSVIASIHGDCYEKLIRRAQISKLLDDGTFDFLVELSGVYRPSEIKRIVDLRMIKC